MSMVSVILKVSHEKCFFTTGIIEKHKTKDCYRVSTFLDSADLFYCYFKIEDVKSLSYDKSRRTKKNALLPRFLITIDFVDFSKN